MYEEQNRFSLRKLSIGLASVLVGVSIFGTSQAVKADTVTGQTTSTVTNSTQSSNTQENKNAVKSSFSNNNNNNNQVDNAKSNLIKTKEATDSNDLDAEKSVVRTSSLQEPDNQSNNHAEDNSQSQNEQKLNLPKNSKKLAKKVLATNLTETQPQQDISKVTDSSKIDASHFADGTRWTPAGWTRADKNTKVAKSSKLDIEWNNGSATDKPTAWVNQTNIRPRFKDITFTIDKDDLRQGNNILIGTIQSMPTNGDKQFADYIKSPAIGLYTSSAMDAQIQFNNQNIGYLYVKQNDASEIDIYLGVNKTFSNLAIDPSFKYTFDGNNEFDVLSDSNYSDFLSYKNHLKYPLDYSLVSNSNILDYQINANTHLVNENSNPNFSSDWIYNDPTWQYAGKGFTRDSNQFNPSNSQTGFVYKIITLQGNKPNLTKSGVNINYDINLVNANGKQTDASVNIGYKHISFKKATDNLTSADLWNATQDGSAMFSNQPDGSLLVCIKPGFLPIDKNKIKNATSTSYLVNIQDPEHAQQIIDNTVNMTKSWSYIIANFGLVIPTANQTHQVIDVTPSNVGEVNIGTSTIGSTTHGGHSDTDIETIKTVKISYVDDDDNSKSVSSDAMTGRQNKVSTYTVNIPKGYYLDDNNTSTGYTWNADHTTISYTFNEDQAKNDANPIEIHLKHKRTAVTDSKQLQTTGKRTITITLPHQDKPMIIIQTVGYKRTGDLDEATNTPTYTDWVFDADTSNVTVDGQISTQYQAYVLKDGVVNYAPIKLPHINGYKARLVRNKINPAMLMVSFMAVSTANKRSLPDEVTPSKPSANPDKSDIDDLQKRSVIESNSNDSGRTMPLDNSTYKAEVPANNIAINLSDLAIVQPIHAQTRTKIHVHKHFKLRKHGKKHIIKHIKHRKKVAKHSKKHAVKHFKHRKKMARQFKKHRL